MKVGLLLDAGQVFSGLRQVNKELLGLQRTQERFNQLAPPVTFTKEAVASRKEEIALLTQQTAAQQTLLGLAKDVAAEDKRRAQVLKAAYKEESAQRAANIKNARRQLELDREAGGTTLLRAQREALERRIVLERRAQEDARVAAGFQIRAAERQAKASQEDVRVNQVLLGLKQEELKLAERALSVGERAIEADRKRAAITENIRDAILALGLGSALQSLNKFSAEAAILAARVENLGTVLRNLGTISGNSLGQLTLYEEQVKQLGITTQAARQVLSLLAANQQDLAQSATLARVAQDAAAIAGINSSEAAERLVIAVERLDTRLLRSLGIVVNLREVYARFARETGRAAETLSAAEKQQLLYNAVIEKGAAIQGTYEASLKDAFKQFTSLDRITQEARKEYGERFVPVFETYVQALTESVGVLRSANAAGGEYLAGLQAFVTVAGAAGFAAIGLSRGLVLLSATATTAGTVLGGLGVAAKGVGSLFGPFTLALGALAAAFVLFSAKAREAEQQQKAFSDRLRADAARGAEFAGAVATIERLGNAMSRTAEQQQELSRSFRVVSGLFPGYSAKLKEAEGNMSKYAAVVREAAAGLKLVNEQTAEIAAKDAERLGRNVTEAFRSASTSRIFGPGNITSEFANTRLKDLFGFSEEDIRSLSGGLRNAEDRVKVLAKVSRVGAADVDQFLRLIRTATGKENESLKELILSFNAATTESQALRDALDAIGSQEFSRNLDRQAGAAETFADELKRQQTDIRQQLQGTAAEEIQGFKDVREAISVRFQTEEELRAGAEQRRRLAISSARQELGLEVDIAQAKVAAAKDENEKKVLELELQKRVNALRSREIDADREAERTVQQGIADLKVREKAIAAIEERIKRTIDLNKQLLEAAQDVNEAEEAGLKARRAGRPDDEVQKQVEQVKSLIEAQKKRAEIEARIKTIQQETSRALIEQENKLANLGRAALPENLKAIRDLEKSIREQRELSATAIEQQNAALKAQQIEVKKLAQEQLNDLKGLVKGFNDARAAKEAFDSPKAVADRQRANQQALTQERIRQEQAGASQIEVEAALADLRNQQAVEEAAKREELEKTARTEQARSKGAFREQRQIEQELKRQGLDPRKRQKDPFKEQRDLRTEETNQLLTQLKPKDQPLKPGQAEAALAEFRRNNPTESLDKILAGQGKQSGNFTGLQQGQRRAEELLPEAQAIGEANAKQEKLLNDIIVVKDGVKQHFITNGKIFDTIKELNDFLRVRVDEIKAEQDKTVEYLRNQGRKSANVVQQKGVTK